MSGFDIDSYIRALVADTYTDNEFAVANEETLKRGFPSLPDVAWRSYWHTPDGALQDLVEVACQMAMDVGILLASGACGPINDEELREIQFYRLHRVNYIAEVAELVPDLSHLSRQQQEGIYTFLIGDPLKVEHNDLGSGIDGERFKAAALRIAQSLVAVVREED